MRTVKDRNDWILPLEPNWSSPVKFEIQYMTDLIRSRSGNEQRHAIRHRPRISLDFEAVATEMRLQQFRAELMRRQTFWWFVKTPWRRARLAEPIAQGGNVLVFESLPFWVMPGSVVMVEDGTHQRAFAVESVDGNEAVLDTNTNRAFAAGTRVYEAATYRLPPEQPFGHPIASVGVIPVRADIVPSMNTVQFKPQDRPQYQGRDLFLDRPEGRSGPSITIMRERETFDPGIHADYAWSPVARPDLQTSFVRFAMGRDRAEDAIGFFASKLGRRTSFWAPEWDRSFEAVATGSNWIEIAGNEFRLAYENSPVFDRMIWFRPDGTYQINRIGAFSTRPNGDTRLTFSNNWSGSMPARPSLRWLLLSRFAADQITPEFLTSDACRIQMAVQSLITSEAVL